VFRDFFSDGRYEQIGVEDAVRYVPWCISYCP